MRLIGAMMNAIGSLLPLQGPSPDTPAPGTGPPGPRAAADPSSHGEGGFTAMLLNLLNAGKAPGDPSEAGSVASGKGHATDSGQGSEEDGKGTPNPSRAEGQPAVPVGVAVPSTGPGASTRIHPEGAGTQLPAGDGNPALVGGAPGDRPPSIPGGEPASGDRTIDRPTTGEAPGTLSPASTPTPPVGPVPAAELPVDRDMGKLDPEFRERLERVVSRMETEFGHQVSLVEGYRSQERQDAIYAQGRTQPGPVATWTTRSLHTRGFAADLQVDGSWDNPGGYARLQQVAREEGLRVLGSRDPGHVELPLQGASERRGQGSRPSGGIPSVAPTARTPAVARVAAAAPVARQASVAGPLTAGPSSATADPPPGQVSPTSGSTAPAGTPGPSSLPGTNSEILDPPAPVSSPALPRRGPEGGDPGNRSRMGGNRNPEGDLRAMAGSPGRNPRSPAGGTQGAPSHSATGTTRGARAPDRAATRTPTGATREPDAPAGEETTRIADRTIQPGLTGGQAPGEGIRSPAGIDGALRPSGAQRVQEILHLTETWENNPAGRILLDLENADGAGTRLRLALRGSELAGTMDLSDPALASRMRQRIGELHESLSRQGLDASALDARAVTGIEGRRGADGDLSALLKDPLAGLVRMMESRESSSQGKQDGQRQARDETNRGWDRSRDHHRDRDKENPR